MTKDCREFLQGYAIKYIYGKEPDYDFYKLFKIYSAYEINCPEDIKKAVDEFYKFLEECNKAIYKGSDAKPLKLFKFQPKVLHHYFESPLTPYQNTFLNIVEELAPKQEKTSILDVGAGMYPKSSIQLAKKFANVSAIDKTFILSLESMQAMHIKPIESLFDLSTQIAAYDFVIGRRPCSAIETIVQLCATQNKPYFIELCDCCLPKNPNPKEIEWWGWENVLPAYDPNIKFFSRYAYNVGDNDKATKVIHKHLRQEEINADNKKKEKKKIEALCNSAPSKWDSLDNANEI